MRHGHICIYDIYVHLIRLVFLGERCGRLYVLRGQHIVGGFGWLSDSKTVKQEDQRTSKALESLSTMQGGEQETHSSINRRLSWYEETKLE